MARQLRVPTRRRPISVILRCVGEIHLLLAHAPHERCAIGGFVHGRDEVPEQVGGWRLFVEREVCAGGGSDVGPGMQVVVVLALPDRLRILFRA